MVDDCHRLWQYGYNPVSYPLRLTQRAQIRAEDSCVWHKLWTCPQANSQLSSHSSFLLHLWHLVCLLNTSIGKLVYGAKAVFFSSLPGSLRDFRQSCPSHFTGSCSSLAGALVLWLSKPLEQRVLLLLLFLCLFCFVTLLHWILPACVYWKSVLLCLCFFWKLWTAPISKFWDGW